MKKVKDNLLDDSAAYQWLRGRLIYLIITKLDINSAVEALSQFKHNPRQFHMNASLKVLKYVKGSHGLRLLLSAKNKLNPTFQDSD